MRSPRFSTHGNLCEENEARPLKRDWSASNTGNLLGVCPTLHLLFCTTRRGSTWSARTRCPVHTIGWARCGACCAVHTRSVVPCVSHGRCLSLAVCWEVHMTMGNVPTPMMTDCGASLLQWPPGPRPMGCPETSHPPHCGPPMSETRVGALGGPEQASESTNCIWVNNVRVACSCVH